jgi:hypothetical protein
MKTAAQLRQGNRDRYKRLKTNLDVSGGARFSANLSKQANENLDLIRQARGLNKTRAVELALETLATIINQGETS